MIEVKEMWITMLLFVTCVTFYTGARTLSLLYTLFPKMGKRARNIGKFIYFIFLALIIIAVVVRGIGKMAGVRNFGFVCMAAFLYLLLSCLVFEIIWGISKLIVWKIQKKTDPMRKWKKVLAGLALVLAVSVTGYGLYHARDLKIKEYSVSIKADSPLSNLKVVLISDLHLGSKLDKAFVKELVSKINPLKPDIICIAGDIFDNDYEALVDPKETAQLLSNLESVYGVYACLGNHDIDGLYEEAKEDGSLGHEKIAAFLEQAKIHLLEDEAVMIADSFVIAGRKDRRPLGSRGAVRNSLSQIIGESNTLPVLLLDHQPQGEEEAKQAGVDLLMCGHTHNGQMFPGNLIVKLTAKYTYGYEKDGDMNVVVTSGAGFWGPPCRVASDSEIVVLNLVF